MLEGTMSLLKRDSVFGLKIAPTMVFRSDLLMISIKTDSKIYGIKTLMSSCIIQVKVKGHYVWQIAAKQDVKGWVETINHHETIHILTIMYTNVDTLTTKITEMLLQTHKYHFDVAKVTEVKPKHSTVSTIVSLWSHWTVTRPTTTWMQDHLEDCYIYVLNSIDHLVTEKSIWLCIKLKGNDSLLLSCGYRSPPTTEQNNTKLFNLLQQIP